MFWSNRGPGLTWHCCRTIMWQVTNIKQWWWCSGVFFILSRWSQKLPPPAALLLRDAFFSVIGYCYLSTKGACFRSSIFAKWLGYSGRRSIEGVTVCGCTTTCWRAERNIFPKHRRKQIYLWIPTVNTNWPERKKHFQAYLRRQKERERESRRKQMERKREILRFCRLPELCLVFGWRRSLVGTGHKTFMALSGCCVSPGLFIK